MNQNASHAKGDLVSTSGYIKERILSEKELQEAKDYAECSDWIDVFQMYNIFHLKRSDIGYDKGKGLGFANTLLKYSRKDACIGFYFLKYIKGSFTRMHHDDKSTMTIVTLLDDKDLVGGQSIVSARYEERARPVKEICSRHKGERENPPYGEEIVPDVIPIRPGESLVYGPDLKHGVSKVYRGERLVLVAWFKDKGEGEE